MNLDSKSFVATDSDIQEVTRTVMNGVRAADQGRTTYLRALVATTIEALGQRIRVNTGKPGKLDDAGVKAQLTALEAVHARFYAVVLATAGETHKGREALNRATNFARTALYAVRVWVRAHNDLTSLAPAKVSKSVLKVVGRRLVRPLSVKRLMSRAEKQSKALISALLALGQEHPTEAAQELELLMGQLTDQLGAITGGGKPAKAVKARFTATRTQILSKAEVARALAQPQV
jgi:hypothetical protein